MIWHDLLIDRDANDPEIRAAVADVFTIQPQDVVVFDPQRVRLVDLPEDAKVVCGRSRVRGDFLLHLGFILRDPEVVPLVEERDDVAVVHEISRRLGANGLIADPENSPYAGLYLPLVGNARRIDLDSDRRDEDEYVMLPVKAVR